MIRALAAMILLALPAGALAEFTSRPAARDQDRVSADRPVTIEAGADFRLRSEVLNGAAWGTEPDDAYALLRAMPYAEMRGARARGFVQLVAAVPVGLRGPGGPAEDTGIDLLQGFAELSMRAGARGEVAVRGGRMLVSLGSERLVSTRVGANVPRAFEGMHVQVQSPIASVVLLKLRPVQARDGAFDDRRSRRQSLRGVYVTAVVDERLAADVYGLVYRNEDAALQNAAGVEQRRTLGLRLFGTAGPLSYNWEFMLQRGHVDGSKIDAWSIATETGYTFPGPLKPLLRLRANVASGDAKAGDFRVGTFNAMYPKARYFGELTPLGPANIMNLHGAFEVRPTARLVVSVSTLAYWRHRRSDGIYSLAGSLLRQGGTSDPRRIGTQFELTGEWKAASRWTLAASVSRFSPGPYLVRSGAAEPTTLLAFEASLAFR